MRSVWSSDTLNTSGWIMEAVTWRQVTGKEWSDHVFSGSHPLPPPAAIVAESKTDSMLQASTKPSEPALTKCEESAVKRTSLRTKQSKQHFRGISSPQPVSRNSVRGLFTWCFGSDVAERLPCVLWRGATRGAVPQQHPHSRWNKVRPWEPELHQAWLSWMSAGPVDSKPTSGEKKM